MMGIIISGINCNKMNYKEEIDRYNHEYDGILTKPSEQITLDDRYAFAEIIIR